jgi:hypothetical protein
VQSVSVAHAVVGVLPEGNAFVASQTSACEFHGPPLAFSPPLLSLRI